MYGDTTDLPVSHLGNQRHLEFALEISPAPLVMLSAGDYLGNAGCYCGNLEDGYSADHTTCNCTWELDTLSTVAK
jgi:hypothetical protein